MTITVYTLWAALEEDPSGIWMLCAIDEFSWEGNPEHSEAEFKKYAAEAKRNGWLTREVNLKVDSDALDKAFEPTETVAAVESP